jgi:hypothetical protein
MTADCCECREPLAAGASVMCADCRGWFHYPDSRLDALRQRGELEEGKKCGVHIFGMRSVFGRDVVPLCLRCDMAFRLELGVPS